MFRIMLNHRLVLITFSTVTFYAYKLIYEKLYVLVYFEFRNKKMNI